MAGDDLNSSLIVPLIKRAEPEGVGGSSPLSWPEGDTPIAEELVGELYVSCGFDLPGAFRLVSAVTAPSKRAIASTAWRSPTAASSAASRSPACTTTPPYPPNIATAC